MMVWPNSFRIEPGAPWPDRSGRALREFCAPRPRPDKRWRCIFPCPELAFLRRTFAWLSSGHEFDDAFPVFASAFRAQFFLQNWQNRPVKLLRLRHAHAMDFESNDVETGARKNFDHAAGRRFGNLKLSGLIRTSVFSTFASGGKLDRVIENAAVAIGKFRPELQIALDGFWVERREHAGLEISHLA